MLNSPFGVNYDTTEIMKNQMNIVQNSELLPYRVPLLASVIQGPTRTRKLESVSSKNFDQSHKEHKARGIKRINVDREEEAHKAQSERKK